MKKDLPRDDRPEVTKWHTNYDFKHPFPHIQVENDFDADFVKDENEDNGEWKAQEHYDHLRIHIAKVQAEVDLLRERAKSEKQLLDNASGEERRLEDKSQQEEQELDAAKAKADRAQAEVERLKTAVAQAKADVEREKRELAGCHEDLVDAQELLERLKGAEEQRTKELQEHEAHAPGQFDKGRPTKTSLPEAEKTAAADHELTVRTKSVYEVDEENYQHWLHKVQSTMALLDRLAARLRAYRSGKDPDAVALYKQEDNGAKSGASSLGFVWPLWLLTAVLHSQGTR